MSDKKTIPLPLKILIGLVFLTLGVIIEQYVTGLGFETTDDSYVNGHLSRISPQVSGTVTRVFVADTQYVEKAQIVLQIDDHDAKIALDQAKAMLAQTVRDIAGHFVKLKADQATLDIQKINLEKAKEDLKRDEPLLSFDSIPKEVVDHERLAVKMAESSVALAEANLKITENNVVGTSIETHPQVKQAAAHFRSAWLNLDRTKVRAPQSGFITKLRTHLGDQVTSSTETMAILPLESVWIDANFKETQLSTVRIGQKVQVTTDFYGNKIIFHGQVTGLTPGTGSSLSVLPAENATGNWIKVVQRLAVRINLDPEEIIKHPLFVGLSTKVTIDTHDQSGPILSKTSLWKSEVSTDAFDNQENGVEEEIRDIIQKNLVKTGGL
jgi:membrane fusion protein (multidrug efflux system)